MSLRREVQQPRIGVFFTTSRRACHAICHRVLPSYALARNDFSSHSSLREQLSYSRFSFYRPARARVRKTASSSFSRFRESLYLLSPMRQSFNYASKGNEFRVLCGLSSICDEREKRESKLVRTKRNERVAGNYRITRSLLFYLFSSFLSPSLSSFLFDVHARANYQMCGNKGCARVRRIPRVLTKDREERDRARGRSYPWAQELLDALFIRFSFVLRISWCLRVASEVRNLLSFAVRLYGPRTSGSLRRNDARERERERERERGGEKWKGRTSCNVEGTVESLGRSTSFCVGSYI